MWARVVDRAETPAPQAGSGGRGPAGPQGPKGDTGATGPQGLQGEVGPQGPAGAGGTGGGATGAQFLSGSGAPASGSGLEPLDGVSDPWRWSSIFGGWVSRIVNVTWVDGATLPTLTAPANATEMDLVVVPGPTLANAGGLGHSITSFDTGAQTIDAAGAGIAYLIQYETNYAGPTTVPDASLAVADYLGAGFTVGDTYTLPEVNTGNDGDTYRDTSAPAGSLRLYGPKAAGTWPEPVTVTSDDPYTVPILQASNGTAYRLTVADDGTLSTEAV